jgi:hypothetical protein
VGPGIAVNAGEDAEGGIGRRRGIAVDLVDGLLELSEGEALVAVVADADFVEPVVADEDEVVALGRVLLDLDGPVLSRRRDSTRVEEPLSSPRYGERR